MVKGNGKGRLGGLCTPFGGPAGNIYRVGANGLPVLEKPKKRSKVKKMAQFKSTRNERTTLSSHQTKMAMKARFKATEALKPSSEQEIDNSDSDSSPSDVQICEQDDDSSEAQDETIYGESRVYTYPHLLCSVRVSVAHP